MGEYRPPQNDEEFAANFAQIHPVMNDTEAYYESSRCLFCYDAPCIKACPTAIDIPLFIRQINTGNVAGAAKTIYEANYFGFSCGKVCPTAVLCEGACVYNHQDVKPIEIGRLQSFATRDTVRDNQNFFELDDSSRSEKIAIVGAGPAGVSCACELRRHGYEVTIFEGRSQPSGLNVHGVAPYKITDDEALSEVEYLQDQFGFSIEYNEPVDSNKLKSFGDDYDAVFIGIGLGETSPADIPGKDLPGCQGAVEFIEALRGDKSRMNVGQTVVVVGGGNTAMDAASESARMGAEKVVLAYRRSHESMGAYDFEYDLAKSVGVEAVFNAQPVAILGDSSVTGIRFARTTENNGSLSIDESNTFTIECDQVIFATGQSKQIELLSAVSDIKLDKGKIVVNDDGQTGAGKYFAGGDAVNGGKEVVNAVAEGKQAANGIHRFLQAKP